MHKIALHAPPRSGTTWLGNILNSNEHVAYRQQPLFSYAFKSALDETATPSEIEKFFKEIYESNDPYLHQINEIRDGKVPKFNKEGSSHLVYKEVRYHYVLENLLTRSDVRVICMIRNPLSVLSSFYCAPSEFDQSWNFLEEWKHAAKKNGEKRENYFGYLKWKESTELFHQLEYSFGPSRVKIVRYSELLTKTEQVVNDLFTWCGLNISEQTKEFIEASKNIDAKNAYSVFKIKKADNKWRETLPKSVINEVQIDLETSPLKIYLEEA